MAIADYQSESDDDAQAREREETKRLLYVALTRARDRLYLSATVQNGVLPDGPGQPGRSAAAIARGASWGARKLWGHGLRQVAAHTNFRFWPVKLNRRPSPENVEDCLATALKSGS